jgi:hypothetical protein
MRYIAQKVRPSKLADPHLANIPGQHIRTAVVLEQLQNGKRGV